MNVRPFGITALTCLALLAAACSDESPQPNAPTMPSAPPSPTVTPTGPDYLEGNEAIPLTIGDPVSMPDVVALIIETG